MNLLEGIEGLELNEDQINAINANVTKNYEGYESAEQIAGLKANNEALLEEKKQASSKAAAAAVEAAVAVEATEAAKLEAAKKSGDKEALTKSYDAKIESMQAQIEEANGKTLAVLKKNEDAAIDSIVDEMAYKLGKDAAVVLKPHIKARLRYEDGKPQVTDGNGSLTISSLDDLETEFKNNPAFASVIVGSQAGGGGAPKGDEALGGGAPSGTKWADMSLEQKTAHLAANPPKRIEAT